MRVHRRAALAAVAGGCVLLSVSSLAWACNSSASPYVEIVGAQSGPQGSVVAVTGGNWVPDRPVRLGWSPDGEQVSEPLGSTIANKSGAISANVTVPAASPGVYYVVAVQSSGAPAAALAGSPETSARVAFQVTDPSQSVSAGTGKRGGTWSGSTGGAPEESEVQPSSDGSETATGTRSAGTSRADGISGTAPAEAAQSGAPGAAPQAGRVVGSSTAPAAAERGGPVVGSGVAAMAGTSVEPEPVEASLSPSPRTAFGNASQGFVPGPVVGLGQASEESRRAAGSPGLALAAQALGLGVVALLGGFMLAETRRRRARSA